MIYSTSALSSFFWGSNGEATGAISPPRNLSRTQQPTDLAARGRLKMTLLEARYAPCAPHRLRAGALVVQPKPSGKRAGDNGPTTTVR
jgi:hypothetical protein